MRDGDVLEGDVELGGPFEQVGADARRDGLPLRDQFGGVELGDDGFEDFVADGGEDALVVVEAEGLEGGEGVSSVEVGKVLRALQRQSLTGTGRTDCLR